MAIRSPLKSEFHYAGAIATMEAFSKPSPRFSKERLSSRSTVKRLKAPFVRAFKGATACLRIPSTSPEDILITMPSSASKKRRQRRSLETQPEKKLSPKQKASRSREEKYLHELDTFTNTTSMMPNFISSKVMKSTGSSTASTSTASEASLAISNAASSTSSTSSEDSQGASIPHISRKERAKEWTIRSRHEHEKDFSPEEKDALTNFFRWDWASAAARPPRPVSPNLGPMDEAPGFDDPISTGYQGMPREQCRLLDALKEDVGLTTDEMDAFENIYRQAKECELAGFSSHDKTPEEVLKKEIELHREAVRIYDLEMQLQAKKEREEWERLERERAEQRVEEENAQQLNAERERVAMGKHKKKFGGWEGAMGQSSWGKQWQVEDLPTECLLSLEE